MSRQTLAIEYSVSLERSALSTAGFVQRSATSPVDAVLWGRLDAYGRRTQLSATIECVKDLKNTYSYNDTTGTVILTQASQSGGTIVLPKRVELATNTLGQTSSMTRYAATTATNLVATTTYTYDMPCRTIGRFAA